MRTCFCGVTAYTQQSTSFGSFTSRDNSSFNSRQAHASGVSSSSSRPPGSSHSSRSLRSRGMRFPQNTRPFAETGNEWPWTVGGSRLLFPIEITPSLSGNRSGKKSIRTEHQLRFEPGGINHSSLDPGGEDPHNICLTRCILQSDNLRLSQIHRPFAECSSQLDHLEEKYETLHFSRLALALNAQLCAEAAQPVKPGGTARAAARELVFPPG